MYETVCVVLTSRIAVLQCPVLAYATVLPDVRQTIAYLATRVVHDVWY